jgi:hypothetical protein
VVAVSLGGERATNNIARICYDACHLVALKLRCHPD